VRVVFLRRGCFRKKGFLVFGESSVEFRLLGNLRVSHGRDLREERGGLVLGRGSLRSGY